MVTEMGAVWRLIQIEWRFPKIHYVNKKSTSIIHKNVNYDVDNVDNYCWRRCSPIRYTSPAPIVINKSLFMHFSDKNFSISSKDGK